MPLWKWSMAIALAATPFCVQGELVMVYELHRNGARNIIPRNSTLKGLEYSGGPTLLPQGKKQCYNAGLTFRKRYIDPSSCGETCLPSAAKGANYGVVGDENTGFNNYNLFANSSALSRSVLSASSFFMGVFGTKQGAKPYDAVQTVPVFSVEESEDYKIRSFTHCPKYGMALDSWYNSPEFKEKESATKWLRDTIQALVPGLDCSLKNWFAVFDAFNLWQEYGIGENPFPALQEAIYNQVAELAMWLEVNKVKSPIASNLIGGALLGDILKRITKAVEAVNSNAPTYYEFLSVSGHYNLQLGLLAALGVDTLKGNDITWSKKIPSAGAVIAVELHKAADGGYWVKAVYQDGPDQPYGSVPLPCATDGGVEGACKLEDFSALASPKAFKTAKEWCTACGNTEMLVCGATDRRALLRGN